MNLEAGALCGQPRAAADRTDDQVGQCHRRIQPAIVERLEPRDADRGFGHARRVLTAGDEEGGEAVGVVALDADAAAHDAAERRHPPVVDERFRCRVQPLLDRSRATAALRP